MYWVWVGRYKDVSQVSGTSMRVGFSTDTRAHKTVKLYRSGQVKVV